MATQVCIFNPTTNLIEIIAGVSSNPFISASAGAPVVLNASGSLDISFMVTPISAYASSNLAAGNLVNLYYNASGAEGAGIYARLASANSASNYPAHGYVAASSISGAPISVYSIGLVNVPVASGLSLSDVGAQVYLSSTTSGSLTKTAPTAPNSIQPVGYVCGFSTGFVSISFAPNSAVGSVTGTNFVYDEVPSGTIQADGSNAVFTLAHTPNPPSSLQFFKNGRRLDPVTAFNLVGSEITYVSSYTPSGDDTHIAGSYTY